MKWILLLLTFPVAAASEADWVELYCNGEVEHALQDRTRVDCLTNTHAIEYDFARKWAEAVGQSLHYSVMTGQRAGIVLILRTPADERHWKRLVNVIETHGLQIDAWPLRVYKLQEQAKTP
ncbi:hypothetical protein NFHSH190041_20100 [Shewanella sp. NFH-SH190041]|uniref:hypothetical protein n=1 Tax=Shewanella sp. NFH-SH190041 TaxID=2950245 RepID=UPI0021C33008|nr:hypothetical protein [Shewanella sp. NFH-SH190041]BDM64558.1 hypothetical protein NFHSH190041_20100 [Shewanella sp. NFH-SH190041]